MSIFIDQQTRLVVQGITGRDGSFHARQMIAYGTTVVAGVTPGKGGQRFDDTVPVFDTNPEMLRIDSDGLNGGKPMDVTAGATIKDPVNEVGGGRMVASVVDPDGNVLGLIQDKE